MDLFTYLMAKKGHNTHRDLFSYLLGKNAGGSGTYTTFSGTSLNISNTLQAKIKNIALEGNTSQDGTPTPDTPIPIKVVTGEQSVTIQNKNLCNVSQGYRRGYINANGGAFKAENVSYVLNQYIEVVGGNTYTYSTNQLINNMAVYSYNENKEFIKREKLIYSKNMCTVTVDSNAKYILLGGNYNNYNAITQTILNGLDIQLENGSTATTYVPYQSQNYPLSLGNIELYKIGDYQDKIAKSTGKNLLSSELETGGISTETGQNSSAGRTRTKDYINIQPNTEYTLSADYQGWYVVYYYNESQTFISSLANNSNKITFTTPSNAKYLRCVVAITNAQNVMLNTGPTALPYEPYGASWYLYKIIDKITLSNSDSFTLDRYSLRFTKVLDTIYEKEGYSNRYIYGGTYQTTGKFEILSSGRLAFNYPDSNIDTVEELQAYLTANELYMYLPLATPTYTEITDTTLIQQLENINNNASSYKDTTIIECTSESTDNETIGFSGDIKVTSIGLGNSLNTSLLSSNLQEETNINDIQEEPNLDDVNEIEEQNDEPIQNEEEVS